METLNFRSMAKWAVALCVAMVVGLTGMTLKDVIEQKEATKQSQVRLEETGKALANKKANQQMIREDMRLDAQQAMESHTANEAAFNKAKREGDARVQAAMDELQRGREQRSRDSAR